MVWIHRTCKDQCLDSFNRVFCHAARYYYLFSNKKFKRSESHNEALAQRWRTPQDREHSPTQRNRKTRGDFYIQGYWILLCVLILYLCYKCIFLYALEGTCKDVEWIFFLEPYFILVSNPLDFLTVAKWFYILLN